MNITKNARMGLHPRIILIHNRVFVRYPRILKIVADPHQHIDASGVRTRLNETQSEICSKHRKGSRAFQMSWRSGHVFIESTDIEDRTATCTRICSVHITVAYSARCNRVVSKGVARNCFRGLKRGTHGERGARYYNCLLYTSDAADE